MNHDQAVKILGHDPQRCDGHYPNRPRTHDGQGNRVDEAVQCVRCLRAWPCETYRAALR